MRTHTGMKPKDIVVLLKILSMKKGRWHFKDMAWDLKILPSEISVSLDRSEAAGLLKAGNRKQVCWPSFAEFLEHGLRYVFPVILGPSVNGIYTALAHPLVQQKFETAVSTYVWPHPDSKLTGYAVKPFYKKQLLAVQKDPQLYLMLSLVDMIRIGNPEEINFAVTELKRLVE